MTKDSPSPTERKLLNIIHRYISEHGELPIPGQLVDDFGETLSYILTLAKRLERKGFIAKHGNLLGITQKAEQYFSGALKPIRPNSVVPTQVQVVGTVKAGKTTPNELEVNLNGSGELILLPNTKIEKNCYALQVIGNSMEHEGIFEGDYVIVEEFINGFEWPSQGDLIVAKYFPLKDESEEIAEIPETDYMDLTLKIYAEQIEQGKKVYRLGWKKDNQSNPHVISASRLIPKGKVIGVYRNIRANKFSL